MAFDAFIVAFGLARTLIDVRVANTSTAYGMVVTVGVIVAALLLAFFRSGPVAIRGVRS